MNLSKPERALLAIAAAVVVYRLAIVPLYGLTSEAVRNRMEEVDRRSDEADEEFLRQRTGWQHAKDIDRGYVDLPSGKRLHTRQ